MTVSCPCCGYGTIENRGVFELCMICWWEDDGEDTEDLPHAASGCNSVDIGTARRNFILYGINDPKRIDLLEHREQPKNHPKLRHFELDPETGEVTES